MDYENDPYVDEDGEPLMDPDVPSDREGSPDPEDHFDGDDVEGDGWRRERSPTPAFDEDKVGRPRKRLVKKAVGKEGSLDGLGSGGLDDWDDEEADRDRGEEGDEPSSSSKKRKVLIAKEGKGGSGKKQEKKKPRPERERERDRERLRLGGKGGKAGLKGYGGEEEMQEFWDNVAGGDSEV